MRPAGKTFVNKIYIKLSAEGLQINDFRCLKRKNRKEWF